MKRIFSSLITVLLLTFFCNAQDSKIFSNGKAIICGHSDVPCNELQTIAVDISGIIEMKGKNYIDFINRENGDFKFNIDISNTKDISLEYNNKILTLFVSPGDSIFIQFDRFFETCPQSDIVNRVTYFGSHAEINKTILEYQAFKGDSSFIPDCAGKTVEEYKTELSKWISNRENKITQFTNIKNTSKEFVDWAKFDNVYSNANYLVDFTFYLAMNKKHLVGNLFDTSIFPVNNDKALISRQYRFYLNQYFIFKYFRDSTVQSLISKKDYYSGYKKALNLILANEPTGASRDIMVNDLYNRCLLNDQLSYQRLQKEFTTSISDKYIRSESEKCFNAVINQPKSIEFISSSNCRDSIIGDLFKEIETRFKDKVIYIDIWSTWCSSCMHEFPYSQKLNDLYKGKNIEFVYICMNSSKENWQRTRTRLKLGGNHFYLNKIQSDIFSNKFQTHGFPTYLLIDKKGQLVDSNAPRPSNSNIKDKIDKLLNE